MHDVNPERVRSALQFLDPHDRKTWVKMAMAIRSEMGEDGFDLWDDWGSAHHRPASEVKSTWRSAKPGGKVGLGSLFYDAKLAGWQDDSKYERPSAAVIAERKAKADARAEQYAKEEAEAQAAAAVRAQRLWDAAVPADTHPYAQRKGVQLHGLRVGSWEYTDPSDGEIYKIPGCLLIPMYDRQRNLHTLQGIEPGEGRPKRYLKDGRKIGCFYPIGKPQMIDGRRVFVLGEGYATCASVHEDTGHMVLVCFDTSNLAHVARAIRERDPEAIILFAADNDLWNRKPDGTPVNPGVETATKVAKEVGGIVAIPPFLASDAWGKDEKGNPTGPTDFNDWHGINGPGSIAEVIDAALYGPPEQPVADAPQPPALAPAELVQEHVAELDDDPDLEGELGDVDSSEHFTVLGYDGDDYWIFHHAKRQVVHRARSHFGSDQGLSEMAPINWWEMYFNPKRKGVDRTMAYEWFMNYAHARGIYDPRRVRGRGAWRDNGRVVFHHGDHLSVDGEIVDIGAVKSKWVYPMSKSMPKPAPQGLTDAEGQHLLNVAKMARWSRPGSAALLAGWVFLSPVCGALGWRPHIWITGKAGSGKSTLFEAYAQALLDGISEPLAGDSTEPGIRQSVRADAVPILIDEFEPNDEADRKRMKGILTTARQASTETSAQTAKGTTTGDGMRFHVRSMFCFASINTMLDKDSDKSRITPLELRPAARTGASDDQWKTLEEELHKIKRAGTWPAKLLARALSSLPTILANVEVFCRAAATRFGTQRDGDQYGTLLAGTWSLTRGTEATLEQAMALIDEYDWTEHKESGDGMDDPQKALASVMEAKVRVVNTDVTVYEMLAEAAGRPLGSLTIGEAICVDTLRRNGIRLEGKDVLFGTGSKSLRDLVKDTSYATDLRGQLRRLPGAHVANNETRKFAGVTSKVVGVPLTLVLGEDEPPI